MNERLRSTEGPGYVKIDQSRLGNVHVRDEGRCIVGLQKR